MVQDDCPRGVISACNRVSSLAAVCYLSDDIHDYHFVSQGKVTVASIDDAEELQFTDVSDLGESSYPAGSEAKVEDFRRCLACRNETLVTLHATS